MARKRSSKKGGVVVELVGMEGMMGEEEEEEVSPSQPNRSGRIDQDAIPM